MPAPNPSYTEEEWNAAHLAARAVAAAVREMYGQEAAKNLRLWKPGQSGGWGDNTRFQVAWEEGPQDWAISKSPELSDEFMPEGWHVEPYYGWLLTVHQN